jgi:hypothetical protein
MGTTGSRQQELQVFAGEALNNATVVGAEDGVGQIALLLLQFQDLLLDGPSADQPVGEDVLASLLLDRPPEFFSGD